MTVFGVDYASVDGGSAPNLTAFKHAGGSFVWLRCSFGLFDKSHNAWKIVPDSTFARDWASLAAAGLMRGAYMGPAISASHSAEEQVGIAHAAIAAHGGLVPGKDFPFCIDLEFPKGIAGTGLDRAGVLKWVRAAVAEAKRLFGCWPIIYTSGRVWNDNDTDCLGDPPAPDLTRCPLWLARYAYPTNAPAVIPPPDGPAPPVPHPWLDEWHAHQDQGDALGVPGFTCTVDIDRFRVARQGDHGGHVAWLQRALGMSVIDGVFGPATATAVHKLQVAHGLTPDEVVGPRTFAAVAWAMP